MKYLVLGSAGQIGAPLCEYLRSKGHTVTEYDIASNEYHDLRVARPRSMYLDCLMSEADFVFFLAFDVGGSTYLKKYEKTKAFIDNNILIMKNTFDLLAMYRVPFMFASSQMSDMSYSAYGVLKRLGEFYTSVLGGITVKFWNVYGPEHDPEKTHVITDFISMAKDGDITMLTDGSEMRQFLYVEDCCECLHTLSSKLSDLDLDAEYHITNFSWDSIEDVAKIIAKSFGCSYNKGESSDEVQKDKRNEPDPHILEYWKPTTDLETGIHKIIEEMT